MSRLSGNTPHVLVIGAGIGGLAAAIRLAKRGCSVTVLERSERVGGKLNVLEEAGYRFDTGPSVLTMPYVLEQLFIEAGSAMKDHLELVPLETTCRYHYPDGSRFDASSNLTTMVGNLETFSAGSGEDFIALLGRAAQAWRGSHRAFLEYPITTPLDLLRHGIPWRDLAALSPWPSLWTLARRHMRDPRLWPFVGRYATYTGSSPWRTPGTLLSILYAEIAFGSWYVRGGLYEIARTLENLALELGVKFEFDTEVNSIELSNNATSGVRLRNGTRLDAQAIICNADAGHLYGTLLPKGVGPPLDDREPSLSGFVILIGLKGKAETLAHHNVWFSSDYGAEFRCLFEEHQPSTHPTIYVSASSRTDPSVAPAGGENLFILVNAPSLGPHPNSASSAPSGTLNWQMHAEAYSELVLQELADRGFDVRGREDLRQVITPSDLAARAGAWRGSIYGTSSNGLRSAFFRPRNRSTVRGLYLASGSAHPGGGLPLVLRSGALAATALLEDFC